MTSLIPELHLVANPMPKLHLMASHMPELRLAPSPMPELHLVASPMPELHLATNPITELCIAASMIGVAGELDCFSAHIRLRELGKSENKTDSNCNSFGFHGGSVEGGSALLAPITSEDGEKVRRLQHQGVREEEGGRRVPREHEALRPVRDRHGFRRGDVSARGREAAGVCVHLVRSQCQERHGGEELMTPPIQRRIDFGFMK
ncbi:hypothetical protein BHM03_00041128 [Ensete ventricosum]|nr:hypothetical protein BHM03_00041128 [Ensete ventricosum]